MAILLPTAAVHTSPCFVSLVSDYVPVNASQPHYKHYQKYHNLVPLLLLSSCLICCVTSANLLITVDLSLHRFRLFAFCEITLRVPPLTILWNRLVGDRLCGSDKRSPFWVSLLFSDLPFYLETLAPNAISQSESTRRSSTGELFPSPSLKYIHLQTEVTTCTKVTSDSSEVWYVSVLYQRSWRRLASAFTGLSTWVSTGSFAWTLHWHAGVVT
jgi:hypothetical protein